MMNINELTNDVVYWFRQQEWVQQGLLIFRWTSWWSRLFQVPKLCQGNYISSTWFRRHLGRCPQPIGASTG